MGRTIEPFKWFVDISIDGNGDLSVDIFQLTNHDDSFYLASDANGLVHCICEDDYRPEQFYFMRDSALRYAEKKLLDISKSAKKKSDASSGDLHRLKEDNNLNWLTFL